MTVPCTSDFFEPQKSAVMLSSLENRSKRLIRVSVAAIRKNRQIIPIPRRDNSVILNPSNIFSAKDWQKAVYTISRIVSWSDFRSVFLCLSANAPNLECRMIPSATGTITCKISLKIIILVLISWLTFLI